MATRQVRETEQSAALADALRSLPVVVILTALVMWVVLTLKPDLGATLTTMIVGYFALDLVSSFVLRGGRGFAFSPLMDAIEGNARPVARPKGHAYVLYLVVIGVSAWALPSFADSIIGWGAVYVGAPIARAILAASLAGAIGYSTHVRFYRKP